MRANIKILDVNIAAVFVVATVEFKANMERKTFSGPGNRETLSSLPISESVYQYAKFLKLVSTLADSDNWKNEFPADCAVLATCFT